MAARRPGPPASHAASAARAASFRRSGSVLGAQVDDQLAGLDGRLERVRHLRAAVARDEVEHRDVRRQLLGRERHLEVRDLRGPDRAGHVSGQVVQQRVAVERGVAGDAHRRVQPAEQRLALGVHLVVYVGGCAEAHRAAGDPLEPVSRPAAVARGHRQHDGPRIPRGQRRAQPLQARRVEEVHLVHHDGVRLGKLPVVDVQHLLRERSARFQAQHARRPDRVDEDAQRRDLEGVPVHPAQRIADRGPQVRAASHRLGDEDVRPRLGVQPVGRVHQGVEPAAEAAAGDLLHRESLRAGDRGVDQADALVVGDQPDPLALLRQEPREPDDRRRLAGAQKAADHDVAGPSAARGRRLRFRFGARHPSHPRGGWPASGPPSRRARGRTRRRRDSPDPPCRLSRRASRRHKAPTRPA